jgi:hypothetical protein
LLNKKIQVYNNKSEKKKKKDATPLRQPKSSPLDEIEVSHIHKKSIVDEIIDNNKRKKTGMDELDPNPRKKSEKLILNRDSEPRGFNLLTNDDYKSSPIKSREYNLLEKNKDKQRDINKE